ncbi:hypothetical protein [Falsiroseomonas tokyonensis]|uniref:Uncharacterized protein n=1 Tax=Falsiroseomonas tokyonensis TaxID=430521 RepID=A0ABV7C1M0_9PROT|nr:hypothetical protein [Falsiroseomonas tokyonensis]MBU8541759.1 hypothetical protein [Falsiroseomonas tokyonensis]OYW68326.1 MAG: hypothetical protein B7Z40_03485 [Bosea sp. 12-68-7]OYX03484.1 MAG: hypothetical protein B7Z14_00285 [Bosea sp. 32-68-6]
MTWNYRILQHPDGTFALQEVYCDESGRPDRYTEQPVSFAVDADEGTDCLVAALELALCNAKQRPVPEASSIGGNESQG